MKYLLLLFLFINNLNILAEDWNIIDTDTDLELRDIEIINNKIIVSTANSDVLISDLNDNNWQIINTDMLFVPTIDFTNKLGVAFSLNLSSLDSYKLFKSTNNGIEWDDFYDMTYLVTRTLKVHNLDSISFIANKFNGTFWEIVYILINSNGDLINEIKICSDCSTRKSLIKNDTILIATESGEIYSSENDSNMTFIKIDDLNVKFKGIKLFNNRIFAWSATELFFSDFYNNDYDWNKINPPIEAKSNINNLYVTDKNVLYLITDDGKSTCIHKTSNLQNWKKVLETNNYAVDEYANYADSLLFIPTTSSKIIKLNLNNGTSVKTIKTKNIEIVINNNKIILPNIKSNFKMNRNTKLRIFDISGKELYKSTFFNSNNIFLNNNIKFIIVLIENEKEVYFKKIILE